MIKELFTSLSENIKHKTTNLFFGTVSVLALAALAIFLLPEITMAQNTLASIYNDPFDYCAAVGTIDTPDERYIGARMPDSIIQGMIRQGIVSADAPQAFQLNAVWRCMNDSVWVCHFGANIPCLEKADKAQVPTSGIEDYCKTHPTAKSIPAAVTGRATVYEWECKDGKPGVVRQIFKGDQQGYMADFWHELSRNKQKFGVSP